jgi:alpha-galactosidase
MHRKSIIGTLWLLLTACVGVHLPQALHAQQALAPTPPMGWNSWNKFGCNVSEQLIRTAADQMVASGMKAAGYQYVVIDDCWQVSRDAAGNIVADPARFPSGIKALADYVHGKGLKFGIYSDAGTRTCAGRPGSRGHEFQDALQYAAWGVDYLKFDWCNTGKQNAEASYQTMHEALLASGRPIVFSLCEWGTAKPWLWAKGVGNLWRTTGDIEDKWQAKDRYQNGMIDIVDMQVGLESFAGPGHWNDPDMLEVGNGGMTDEEYRTHFSLWAMLAAPLIAGNDLANMSSATKATLMNQEVIAIDQDVLGHEGHRVRKDGDLEVWTREIAGGDRAAILLNRSLAPQQMTLHWEDIGYPANVEAAVRDLWKHADEGRQHGSYTAIVPAHGVVMLTIRP